MRTLALSGGMPIVTSPIKPMQSLTMDTIKNVEGYLAAVYMGKATLSGYLAGSERGGVAVQRLEELWSNEFSVKHSIACNSCTSALLAAFDAASMFAPDVVMPTMGMSAAAATAKIMGLKIRFTSIDNYYGIDWVRQSDSITLGINLFGQPIEYGERIGFLIEDNAQAPWAGYRGRYAGTIGDIGCWSMNVHKPLNAGEGGMITTNDDGLAKRMRGFINHGEVIGQAAGLNLRMTELTAIITLSQMQKAKEIVLRQAAIASLLNAGIGEDTDFTLPRLRPSTSSAWYCYPLRIEAAKRDWAVNALCAEGVPCRGGYTLMHQLSAFSLTSQRFRHAEEINDQLILIELASLDPSPDQITQMAEAIRDIGTHR